MAHPNVPSSYMYANTQNTGYPARQQGAGFAAYNGAGYDTKANAYPQPSQQNFYGDS